MAKMIVGNAAVVGFVNFVAEDGKRALIGTGNVGEGENAKPNGIVDDINTVTVFLENGVSLEKGKKVRVFGDLAVGEYEGKASLSMTVRSEKQVSESTEATGLEVSGFVNFVKDNRLLLGTGGYKDKDGNRVNFESLTVFVKKGMAVPEKGARLVFKTALKVDSYNDKQSLTANINSDKQYVTKAKDAAPAESGGDDI